MLWSKGYIGENWERQAYETRCGKCWSERRQRVGHVEVTHRSERRELIDLSFMVIEFIKLD